MDTPAHWVARLRSIRHALSVLDAAPGPPLLILPTTRSALLLARELSFSRECCVMAGPISSDAEWQLGPLLRAPHDIAQAFIGMPALPRSVITFPDQIVGADQSFTW